MFVIIILSMTDYYQWLKIDLKHLVEVAFIFLVIWVVQGLFLILNAQSQIKKWAKIEHEIISLQVGRLVKPNTEKL